MKHLSLVPCAMLVLIVSCFSNTRWWDTGVFDDPEEREGNAGSTAAPPPAAVSAVDKQLRVFDTQTGIASFMADEINGRMTANGELYDMRQLTAAHPSLPFGAIVEVKNLANSKTVRVRINDRGPYVTGRIVDLSFQAARELELTERGSGMVELKIIQLPR